MSKPGRQVVTQERAIRTRERLLDAAAEEFAANGYAGATLAGVIERTGMTKGALYGHFSCKEDLAVALLEQATGVLVTLVSRTPEPSVKAREALRDTMLALVRHMRGDSGARSALRLELEAPYLWGDPGVVARILGPLSHAVARAQAEGGAAAPRPPEVVAQLLLSVFLGVPHPVPRDDADAAGRFDDLWEALSAPTVPPV